MGNVHVAFICMISCDIILQHRCRQGFILFRGTCCFSGKTRRRFSSLIKHRGDFNTRLVHTHHPDHNTLTSTQHTHQPSNLTRLSVDCRLSFQVSPSTRPHPTHRPTWHPTLVSEVPLKFTDTRKTYFFCGIARKTATSPVMTTTVSAGCPSVRTPVVVTVISMLQIGLDRCTFVTTPLAVTVSPTRTGAAYLRFCCMKTEPGPGSSWATRALSAPLWIPPWVISDLKTVLSA
mmetsp:Transcript_20258/g.27524  ORF Transcript_20258/g.27524 Transcript_20258/m.27524 type:complete len:233 (-) Transcript_20258:408-1106(-)